MGGDGHRRAPKRGRGQHSKSGEVRAGEGEGRGGV